MTPDVPDLKMPAIADLSQDHIHDVIQTSLTMLSGVDHAAYTRIVTLIIEQLETALESHVSDDFMALPASFEHLTLRKV